MIAEAKAEGDISENAGYDEAKATQGFVEGRIRELENILKHAEVISTNGTPANQGRRGRTVVVQEVDTDFEESYKIVGSIEADPTAGRINNQSRWANRCSAKRRETR